MVTEDYVLQPRIFMLRILLRIWQAQKYTFEQHSPGKNAFAPLAQLAEQLTLNSKQLFGLFFPFLIWSGLAGTNQMVDG